MTSFRQSFALLMAPALSASIEIDAGGERDLAFGSRRERRAGRSWSSGSGPRRTLLEIEHALIADDRALDHWGCEVGPSLDAADGQ
ncbi:MAG: hypothetical protein IPM35_41625 [Myxococcales bacterium]|nr:hypothetical protein [Myxococcales bacterium]